MITLLVPHPGGGFPAPRRHADQPLAPAAPRPLLFNHCLFRAGMSRCEAVLSVALIGLCLALTALIAYNSAYELLDSLGLLAGPPGVPPAP